MYCVRLLSGNAALTTGDEKWEGELVLTESNIKCLTGSINMGIIRKTASYILLISAYIFTWLVAVLGRMIPRKPWKPTGRIMVTGSIFNPNWYLSHITPLTRSGVTEVILVIDEPQQPLERVRFACPPKWLARIISRAGAKAIWVFYAGIRYRPDLFIGYNLVLQRYKRFQ